MNGIDRGKAAIWGAVGVTVLAVAIWAIKGNGAIGLGIAFGSFWIAFFLAGPVTQDKYSGADLGLVIVGITVGLVCLSALLPSFEKKHHRSGQYDDYYGAGDGDGTSDICEQNRFGMENCY